MLNIVLVICAIYKQLVEASHFWNFSEFGHITQVYIFILMQCSML